MSQNKDKKYQTLLLGLLFDGIGMLSFVVPFIGDFSDIIWAPLAGWLMTRLYKGKVGQAAGVFTFIDENNARIGCSAHLHYYVVIYLCL